ncbi:MAG: hypothetical protein GQ570_06295 [Helicobacteraceae bacterium]|nr:hypothetical protein [Helicobacteraceae bacterium]
MIYKLAIERQAISDLRNIYQFILKNSSKAKADSFLEQLRFQIVQLSAMANVNRESKIVQDELVKDLLYKSYTIVYKIRGNNIHVLSVFRLWD